MVAGADVGALQGLGDPAQIFSEGMRTGAFSARSGSPDVSSRRRQQQRKGTRKNCLEFVLRFGSLDEQSPRNGACRKAPYEPARPPEVTKEGAAFRRFRGEAGMRVPELLAKRVAIKDLKAAQHGESHENVVSLDQL